MIWPSIPPNIDNFLISWEISKIHFRSLYLRAVSTIGEEKIFHGLALYEFVVSPFVKQFC